MVRATLLEAVLRSDSLGSHVPVIASGFEDLQKRVEAQTQQATEQQQKIKVCPS